MQPATLKRERKAWGAAAADMAGDVKNLPFLSLVWTQRNLQVRAVCKN